MYNQNVWRLIPLLPACGNIQMAIDKWLLKQHECANHPPTLRFYTWSPSAISLGYHQKQYPQFWHDLIWQGDKLDVVRRPSGGRAVLHQGDLCYAVIASSMGKSRMQAYTRICQFLITGWRSLGFDLNYGQAGRGYIHNPNCFGTATGADLILPDGRKFIGSAQLRRGEAILQHGSIPIAQDANLYNMVFGFDSFIHKQNTTNLFQNLSQQNIIDTLITAACECFHIKMEVKPLTEDEWTEISVLCSI
ncbi:lipoate--protein ligase family protein [Anabaena sp. FACHB-1237]|uniref:lipoate--protein ligase family protein n=1 Tax=Anabaena sp. FACHB-1237 TaxID=2692769 RepID=UPI001680C55C|nr:biotin/lipoate A/B protein ligase family protein [Anabaena sp. FACHB-1237]MBD2137071.1 lipoate--protein ligase family protein [Anabaena sp. FACHB-1237]